MVGPTVRAQPILSQARASKAWGTEMSLPTAALCIHHILSQTRSSVTWGAVGLPAILCTHHILSQAWSSMAWCAVVGLDAAFCADNILPQAGTFMTWGAVVALPAALCADKILSQAGTSMACHIVLDLPTEISASNVLPQTWAAMVRMPILRNWGILSEAGTAVMGLATAVRSWSCTQTCVVPQAAAAVVVVVGPAALGTCGHRRHSSHCSTICMVLGRDSWVLCLLWNSPRSCGLRLGMGNVLGHTMKDVAQAWRPARRGHRSRAALPWVHRVLL